MCFEIMEKLGLPQPEENSLTFSDGGTRASNDKEWGAH